MKIGLGVITYMRPDFFRKVIESIDKTKIDIFCIVNDGTPYENMDYLPPNTHVIQHEKNQGVAKSKNDALRYMLEQNCDYIFLQEDDIIIKDNNIFQKYINLHKITNIHHFNFGYHGPANKTPDKKPSPRLILSYKEANTKMSLNKHCVGAFSFYTQECLKRIGLMDESFINAWEHVEHTFRICQQQLTTPFWWFADIANSYDYLDELACSEINSTIRNNSEWRTNIYNGINHFLKKHGLQPLQIIDASSQDVVHYIKQIKPSKMPINMNKARLLSICSTRGRPDRLLEMVNSFKTTHSEGTKLFVYISNDDPCLNEYKALMNQYVDVDVEVEIGSHKFMPAVINYACTEKYKGLDYYHEVNDDHIFRTPKWDQLLIDAVDKKNGWAFAYGKTPKLPSSVLTSGKLVRTLGYFFSPIFTHTYVDDQLRILGDELNLLICVPEVDIEHMHPAFQKSAFDKNYLWVSDQMQEGKLQLDRWLNEFKNKDVQRVRTQMEAENE